MYVSSSRSSLRKVTASSRAPQVGLRDDFQQRRAGTVQIDETVRLAGCLVVQALARVFFEVGTDDPDRFRCEAVLGVADFQAPALRKRQVVLADLVALRQIGIVILLAVPFRPRRDFTIEGDRCFERELDRPSVHHRQSSRHADADRAGLRVRLRSEPRAARAEQLARRGQLHVHFQADDRGVGLAHSGARSLCQSVACSYMRAPRSNRSSCSVGACSCNPIGRPDSD